MVIALRVNPQWTLPVTQPTFGLLGADAHGVDDDQTEQRRRGYPPTPAGTATPTHFSAQTRDLLTVAREKNRTVLSVLRSATTTVTLAYIHSTAARTGYQTFSRLYKTFRCRHLVGAAPGAALIVVISNGITMRSCGLYRKLKVAVLPIWVSNQKILTIFLQKNLFLSLRSFLIPGFTNDK